MTEITDLIHQENVELCNAKIDQTVICGSKYLQCVSRLNVQQDKPVHKELSESYANPLIFYPHTEDVNYTAKIKHLTERRHKISNCISLDSYSDDNAEEKYLSSNPVSFVILGKPEIGETELARHLSDYWKCIYISPKSVIDDEIVSGTRTGKCIEYNLRNGRIIGPDILLRLVEKRINSQTAQHRGFVICGFPVLPNIGHKQDPISSVSAVDVAQEIFKDLLPVEKESEIRSVGKVAVTFAEKISDSEESLSDDEITKTENTSHKTLSKTEESKLDDDLDLGPSDINILSNSDSSLAEPAAQVEFLFNLFKDPFVIIYIMCDDLDVLRKRCNYLADIHNELCVDTENIQSISGTSSKDQNSINKTTKKEEVTISHSNISVEMTLNSKKNISSQLYQFHLKIHPILEKRILNHDPQYFIKVDGRLPSVKMFNAVRMRLKTLAFQPVLIPQKLWDDEEIEEFTDGEPISKYQNMNIEQIYDELRNRLAISSMYKWQLSNWCFKCPVALKEGKIQTGNPKLAVQFMNKIFFLSNEESWLKFYRNPRSYLLPISPNPTGRIWIMGPQLAGKTIVAKFLSILFDYKILDPTEMEETYKRKKSCQYTENIRSSATSEAFTILNENQNKINEERIREWKNKANELLTKVCNYYTNDNSALQVDELNVLEKELQSELEKLNLPSISQASLIVSLADDNEKLINYLPSDSKDEDAFETFIEDFVKNAIQNSPKPDISMTFTEKVEMFKGVVQDIEEEYYGKYGRRGGWIIDGMPANIEFLTAVGPEYLADDIICLRDDDPENKFLLAKYVKEDLPFFRDFKSFFIRMGKLTQSEMSLKSLSRVDFINYLLGEVQNRVLEQTDVAIDEEDMELEENKVYAESLTQFNENWLETLNYLSIVCARSPININIAYKSAYDLLRESVITVEDRYRRTASVVTEDSRIQERKDFGGVREEKIKTEYDEEQHAGEDDLKGAENFFAENRRLGDTANYCPVAFSHHNVLWKGKEELAVRYEDKQYFFSSQVSLNKFLTYPREFLKNNPPNVFPPVRICIAGVTGSGKTTLAKTLARNLGLHYVNYDSLLLASLNRCLFDAIDIDDGISFNTSLKTTTVLSDEQLEILRDYWNKDIPLPTDYIKRILHSLWLHKPYSHTGFILDNFPHCPSDMSVMIANYFIPDIVIHLQVSQDEMYRRVFPIKFEHWRKTINEQKRLKQAENNLIFDKWQQDRYARLCFLANEKREEAKLARITQSKPIFTTPVDSKMSIRSLETIVEEVDMSEDILFYDAEQEKEDMEKINELLDEEMPEPKFDDNWESDEEATERIDSLIYTCFARDAAYLEIITYILKQENIECINVDTLAKDPSKILKEVIILTEKYKFRNNSLFERVYEISLDIAERLVDQGVFFMSKFGRTCPVQVDEQTIPIHMYSPAVFQSNIFPVIHRRYIYFLVGKESRDKFKHDPLKYTSNSDYELPLIPLRILIIGPPKSGKTSVAERFQQEFHLKLISKDKAIRYVQKQLPNCELVQNIDTVLRNDWSITNEMAARAVEALTLDGKSITQGFILDGFPNSIAEMKHLIALGIVPHVILDIQADYDKIKECLETEINWLNINKLQTTTASTYEFEVSSQSGEEDVDDSIEKIQEHSKLETDSLNIEASIDKIKDSLEEEEEISVDKIKDTLELEPDKMDVQDKIDDSLDSVNIQDSTERLNTSVESISEALGESIVDETQIGLDFEYDRQKIEELYKAQGSSESESEKNLITSYSVTTLKYKYNEWKRSSQVFREWLQKEYDNVHFVYNDNSKWHSYVQASSITTSIWKYFHAYFMHKKFEMAHPMKSLCVTPLEIYERQSSFRNYCPLCLYYNDSLVFCGKYPNRSCVVQFQNFLYYICEEHLNMFLNNPVKYIPPSNTKLLPEELPNIIQGNVTQSPIQDGLCIVTFWENQPKQIIKQGCNNFSLSFKDDIYLFCSEDCMLKFMKSPLKYHGKIIHSKNRKSLELCEIQQLPTLGYLEQFVAKLIIEAIINTEMRRPYLPGLTIAQSASINTALFLKCRNANVLKEFLQIYENATKQFDIRSQRFKEILSYFKNQPNPFVCLDFYKIENCSNADASSYNYESKLHQISEEQSVTVASKDSFLCSLADLIFDNISFPSNLAGARRVPVPDARFDYLCNYYKPASKVPAFLNIVDIAGLVKGASEGQGLGNAFLSHISACDAIFHLCRAFEDDDVTHVEGDVNPVRDLEIIFEELRLKDEEQLMKTLEKVERNLGRAADKKIKPEFDTLLKVKTVLVDEKNHIRFADWSTNDIEILNKHLFLTSKPGIYLVNLSDKDYIRKKNKWLAKIKEWVDKHDPGSIIIPFSGAFEHKLVEFEDEAERNKYIQEVGATSALDKIIVQGYKALQLEYFFTSGTDEVKAWTIQKGTKAPQAAGRIHTDFEKGFIMAEVMKYVDFKEEGSESAVKGAGKYRQQGRNYTVDDGDIILFKFNAGAGIKDGKKK